MPLNAARSGAFVGLVFISALGVSAQTAPVPSPTAAPAPSPTAAPVSTMPPPTTILPPTAQLPSAADIMRQRVTKAKSLVAIKNYAAAIYELENIKRESKDPAVNSVTQVMLMNCYLEQLDYKRAQSFLTEIFNQQKANQPGTNYFAAAGQVVKSARNQLDRYKSLGLTVSDVNLPKEATADVDKMRETLEMVVAQSKTLSADNKLTGNSMILLEEASASRSSLARDEYDAKRWKEAIADARDDLMNSRTAVISAVEDTPNMANTAIATAQKTAPTSLAVSQSVAPDAASNNSLIKKTVMSAPLNQPPANASAVNQTVVPPKTAAAPVPNVRERRVENQTPAAAPNVSPAAETVKNNAPVQIGSLVEYATEKTSPTYPPAARMMRKTGTVRVEVLVDEQGKIAEIQNASGETLLQKAAADALKKWRFKPFTRDGQPVKATGYVNFNFNL